MSLYTRALPGSIFPYEIPTRDCEICMNSHRYDDIYVFDCDDAHKVCYTCYQRSCRVKQRNREILTCALCPFPLKDGELNQLRLPPDELQQIRDHQTKAMFDLYSRRTRGMVKCPREACNWMAQAENPNARFLVQCGKCEHQFCSLCNEQYHYRSTCQQMPQITQRWFIWCQTERPRYLQMRAEQDAAYATQLADYNRQREENERRNQELQRRYNDLMQDEEYKVAHCRLCPSCHRVVERLEGCDAMVCGQDAHGGNVQSGCGTKFNWTQAEAYRASRTSRATDTLGDLPKPNHPLVHHQGVK